MAKKIKVMSQTLERRDSIIAQKREDLKLVNAIHNRRAEERMLKQM
jgi:hypothetical protein